MGKDKQEDSDKGREKQTVKPSPAKPMPPFEIITESFDPTKLPSNSHSEK